MQRNLNSSKKKKKKGNATKVALKDVFLLIWHLNIYIYIYICFLYWFEILILLPYPPLLVPQALMGVGGTNTSYMALSI